MKYCVGPLVVACLAVSGCGRTRADPGSAVSPEAQREVRTESDRLLALARSGPHNAERRAELDAAEAGWQRGREACDSAPDPRACDYEISARQVAILRQGYPDAREDDASGISVGPQVVQCEGVDPPIRVTIVNSHPPVAVLEWGDRSIVATGALESGSVVYRAQGPDGAYVFRAISQPPTLAIAGRPAMACEAAG
jgi:hypothetical protein